MKETSYKTSIGASISCFVSTFFIIFLVLRTTKLILSDDPFFSLTTMGADDVSIDIWNLDFMFAIENIDPRVGRITATKVSWDNRGSESKKEKNEVEMIDCKEY